MICQWDHKRERCTATAVYGVSVKPNMVRAYCARHTGMLLSMISDVLAGYPGEQIHEHVEIEHVWNELEGTAMALSATHSHETASRVVR